MRFTKMHGLGNDYVVISSFDERVGDAPTLARAMSDRHRGVGSDGLLLIQPDDESDLRMEMYNADGYRGEMCGNGLRCVAKYAYEHGLCPRRLIRIGTDCGIRVAECYVAGDSVTRVRVAMGAADYRPVGLPAFPDRASVVDEPFQVHGRILSGTFVSMGNPHLVVFVRSLDEIDLGSDGPALEHHDCFPDRINVHFAAIEARDRVRMVTWERGSGATQACGSGACAVADAAFTRGDTVFPTTVHLPGGDLLIERVGDIDRRAWRAAHGIAEDYPHYGLGPDAGLLMTGPAVEVFTGTWSAG